MSQKQRGKQPVEERPRTPPSNVQSESLRSQQNPMTPRVLREGGGTATQTELRTDIAKTMQHEMLRCSLKTFLEHYAPFSPSPQDVEGACTALVQSNYLKKNKRKGESAWTAFGHDGPSSSRKREASVFAPLQQIADVLLDLDSDINGATGPRKASFRYKDCPNHLVKGELPGSGTFKWDACIRPESITSAKILSSDAAVIAEFKKKADFQNVWENRSQLVSAANYIMNEDPCRMWLYGITIEDKEMSLWYFSRSHSVKSETFDWTRDYKSFVRILLSFLYATEKEIGFDPTIHRVKLSEDIFYVYEVDGRFFRTVELIFNPRVLCISGRKTRVWRVIEVAGISEKELNTQLNEGKHYALKDVWLDEGSDTEGDILGKIFASLEQVLVAKYQWKDDGLKGIISDALRNRQYERYFMTILCHMQGESTKRCARDAVPDPEILNTRPIERTNEAVVKSLLRGSSQKQSSSNHSGRSGSMRPASAAPYFRDFIAKRQYRLIYNDVGTPLDKAPDLGSFFQAVHDACIALILMLLVNWVHRDISVGNIILVVTEGGDFIGKLSDFEYAKRFSSAPIGKNDPKTGTPFFMPWEVHASVKLITPPQLYNLDLDSFDSPATAQSSGMQAHQQWPPFYRYDYDLESLWWIILWTCLSRVLYAPARSCALEVFTYTSTPSPTKTRIMQTQRSAKIKDALSPELRPLLDSIYALHACLYAGYSRDPLNDVNGYLQIHQSFWMRLVKMLGVVQPICDTVLFPPDSKISSSQDGDAEDMNVGGEGEAGGKGDAGKEKEVGGLKKLLRILPPRKAKTRYAHPGKFNHHVHVPL